MTVMIYLLEVGSILSDSSEARTLVSDSIEARTPSTRLHAARSH